MNRVPEQDARYTVEREAREFQLSDQHMISGNCVDAFLRENPHRSHHSAIFAHLPANAKSPATRRLSNFRKKEKDEP
ncbi:hypothetical protein SNOG_10377 [Parastagonospora nodorum SN15]|uniref:Uncharacterized protein n=1 Tax=Phaeosphaeria nodorum (strain SN15 / ATCC MYA-4574 / FGSC 10173) TaxID=321614 RepID=Q0UCY7_PHANO|nr:hypothetical protein SNOG_10377 [Parastagonospora nodorum SN15]EAT81771.1 hypothetical protein SNOG_10377 [Parastagonospora nodorum SN15]